MKPVWIDWHALERSLPLDDLPAFHRAFLALARPEEDYSEAPLRQVQGKVQASLKALERSGGAKLVAGTLLVARAFVPEAFIPEGFIPEGSGSR